MYNSPSRSFALSTCMLFISVIQSVNGAEFLDITCLLFLSDCIASVSAPYPIRVVVSLLLLLNNY